MKKILIRINLLVLFTIIYLGLLISGCTANNLTNQISCDELPTMSHIQQTLIDNKETQKRIENLNPGVITFVIEESKDCPGKAILVIYHATAREEQQIEDLIGNTFFGIPYDLRNI